jgi:hypothetical protein
VIGHNRVQPIDRLILAQYGRANWNGRIGRDFPQVSGALYILAPYDRGIVPYRYKPLAIRTEREIMNGSAVRGQLDYGILGCCISETPDSYTAPVVPRGKPSIVWADANCSDAALLNGQLDRGQRRAGRLQVPELHYVLVFLVCYGQPVAILAYNDGLPSPLRIVLQNNSIE